jgi:hypothetical protein
MLQKILLVLSLTVTGIYVNAQTLQFNQVKIVDNNQLAVPAGKVWKVTSIYGAETRYNLCLNISSSANHELERIRCAYTSNTWQTLRVSYYAISTMVVNGKIIQCRINGLADGAYDNFTGSNCDSQQTSRSANWSCGNMASDPNLFPMWLPAGTTLQTGGANTFASVIEFTVAP